jgi:hypothetical protein
MHGTTKDTSKEILNAKHVLQTAWEKYVRSLPNDVLSAAYKVVLWGIPIHRNVEGDNCFLSLDTLGEGTSRRTAIRAIKRAEELGLIVVARSPGGQECSNRYYLMLPDGVTVASIWKKRTKKTVPSSGTVSFCATVATTVATVPGQPPNSARAGQQQCQIAPTTVPSSGTRTCEHEPLRRGEHVNMASSRSFAAPAAAAAHDTPRQGQEESKDGSGRAKPSESSGTSPRRRQRPLQPIAAGIWQAWQEDVANGNVHPEELDDGCDYKIIGDDGRIKSYAHWNGAMFEVTDVRRSRRPGKRPTTH